MTVERYRQACRPDERELCVNAYDHLTKGYRCTLLLRVHRTQTLAQDVVELQLPPTPEYQFAIDSSMLSAASTAY